MKSHFTSGWRGRRGAIGLIALAAMLVSAAPLYAQSDSTSVQAVVLGTLRIEQATQRAQDEWGAERSALQARYIALKATVAFLLERQANNEQRIAGLRADIADFKRRLAESKRYGTAVRDAVLTAEGRLERSARDDLPFLLPEREKRLANLKAELETPHAAPAELVRRLLEALQFEAAYGGTADVTDERLKVGADSLSARVLRIGRVALFWTTADGKRAGRYDPAARVWVELPSKYRPGIRQATDMAAHLRPAGLVSLPVGRIRS